MHVPRCTAFVEGGVATPWRDWTGGPFRLRDDELWRPDERGRARPRTDATGEDVPLARDSLRWRCVFATTREVKPAEGPLCTTGCAFQIDIHCSSAPQDTFVDDKAAPWHAISGGRYRASLSTPSYPGEQEAASIEIVTLGDRCTASVDSLMNRDAQRYAGDVAALVIRVLRAP
jgi:hypothetical protein